MIAQVAEQAVSPAAAVITAIGACLAAIGTGVAAVMTARARGDAGRAAETATALSDSVGQRNGRGDVVTMIEDLQDTVAQLAKDHRESTGRTHDQVTGLDRRLTNLTSSFDERLAGLHRSVNDKHDKLAERLDNLERPARPGGWQGGTTT